MPAQQKKSSQHYLPKRILVVEDDSAVQSLIKMSFRDFGIHDVYCFADAESGWAELNENRFDLVVLDWNLPGLSGRQMFNRIRLSRTLRSIPVIVASGNLERNDVSLISQFFFSVVIEKPFEDNLLLKITHDVMREKFDHDGIARRTEEVYQQTVGQSQQKTIDLLEKWLQNLGQQPLGVSMVAEVARSVHADEFALKLLSETMKIHQHDSLLSHQYAITLLQRGEFALAYDCFKHANEIFGDNLERMIYLGLLEFNLGHYDEGMRYFDRVRNDDSEAPINKLILEIINFIRGRYTPQKIMGLANGIGHCLAKLAWETAHIGEYANGSDCYLFALAFTPEETARAKIYYNLAVCKARQGKRKRTIYYLLRSLDLDPNCRQSAEAMRAFGFDLPAAS